MSDDTGNRTARGAAPAPFATDDTLAAPVTSSKAETSKPASAGGLVKAEPDASASLSLPVLDRIRYQIIGEVGRGGLGRVFRARDIYLDRQVAVKELLANDEPAQRRFVREALITARLQHPAIVPIYDAGQSVESGPFYSMKLVEGRSLADALTTAGSLDARLALLPSVIAVCDAMAYAHSQNIIHRDLKPQNVLVGAYGETMLIDWGLAKDLEGEDADSVGPYRESAKSTETLDGAVMGTPAFMAPEQAIAGNSVDERSDVYALGSMLYYLGCGSPPHTGKSIDDILIKVMQGDFMPLREREPRIPEDLAAIVTKAMARDPAKRYPTAKELTEDLHKFQLGKLVGAKTYTRVERLRRWVARNRRIVAVTAAALVILLAYGGWSLQKIYEERRLAEHEAERANQAAADAAKQRDTAVAQALLVRARQYAATGHAAEELAVLRVLARPEAGDESRRLAITDGGLIWKGHQRLAMALGREVGLVVRSTDGTRFVATEPGAIVAWDTASGKELARMPYDTGPTAARFGRVAAISPAGRHVIVAVCEKPNEPCGFMIADDDRFVIKPSTRLELRALDGSSRVIATWKAGEELRRRSIAFATDDSEIAIRRGTKLEVIGAHAREIETGDCTGALAIATDGTVAIGCKDQVTLFDTANKTRSVFTKLRPDAAAKLQLAFIGTDRLLGVGADVRLWDLTKNELRGDGKLPEAPDDTSVRDEGEDVDWTFHRPGKALPGRKQSVPQIRIGSSTSIVPRTSILGPPPRAAGDGALVTLEGPDWQALELDHDQLRYALVDHLVPSEPPERCLPRIGGERHAMIALDNGGRMLVDDQELATGLAAAPPEGYRHTTTGELPVRQLRPLLAAEADACLVWGGAIGAHELDAGPIHAGDRATEHHGTTGTSGLLVTGNDAYTIDGDGKRRKVATAALPVESPLGVWVASIDLDTDTVQITDVDNNKIVRSWKASAQPESMKWVSTGVLEVKTVSGAFLVPADPDIAPRPRSAELVTDADSRYGTRIDGAHVIVVRVTKGTEIARYPIAAKATARPLPNDSGSVLIETDGKREILHGATRLLLGEVKQVRLGDLEVVDNHLISRADSTVAVWNLSTGHAFAVPVGVRDVAIRDHELWAITGTRTPRLERIQLDGSGTRSVPLSTAGLPFYQVHEGLTISADQQRVSIEYAVTEALTAIATWDAKTGALLWVGPPAAAVVGDWVIGGGHAYRPVFDVDAILRDTGARTNLRLCKSDLRAVPVSPPPPPDSYWAPDSACTTTAR